MILSRTRTRQTGPCGLIGQTGVSTIPMQSPANLDSRFCPCSWLLTNVHAREKLFGTRKGANDESMPRVWGGSCLTRSLLSRVRRPGHGGTVPTTHIRSLLATNGGADSPTHARRSRRTADFAIAV